MQKVGFFGIPNVGTSISISFKDEGWEIPRFAFTKLWPIRRILVRVFNQHRPKMREVLQTPDPEHTQAPLAARVRIASGFANGVGTKTIYIQITSSRDDSGNGFQLTGKVINKNYVTWIFNVHFSEGKMLPTPDSERRLCFRFNFRFIFLIRHKWWKLVNSVWQIRFPFFFYEMRTVL